MIELAPFNLFLSVFAAAFSVGTLLYVAQQRKMSKRIQQAVLGAARATQPSGKSSTPLQSFWQNNYLINSLKAMSDRIDVLKGEDPEELSLMLASAGYSGREPVIVYAFSKLAGLIFGAVVATIIVVRAMLSGDALLVPVGSALLVMLLVLRMPDFFLSTKRKARQSQIRRSFPQMIELMTIASEAGLGPSPAMLRSAEEMHRGSPHLANELRQLVNELSVLPDRAEAYSRFAKRIALPEAAHFGTALLQGEAFGTSFSATLKIMAKELRALRLVKIEERATRLPVLMTVPLIAFIMPALFVVILGPAALSIIDNLARVGGSR